MRQLQKPLNAAQLAKRTIAQSGLNAKRMSSWSELNLINLLNQTSKRTSKTVSDIVEACQTIIQLDQQLKVSTSSETREALYKEVLKIVASLHDRFLKYNCAPVVSYLPTVDGCFTVQYLLKGPSQRREELQAVAWLLDHIHAVHRIRRCRRKECCRWFFGVTDHQKYCAEDCRKRDGQRGEAFKKQRQRYMKAYRQREREKDDFANRSVGRKSK